MRTIGNILWLCPRRLVAGAVLRSVRAARCVLIVTIPFGIAAFRLAGYTLWPFGRTVIVASDAACPSVIGNIL